MCALKSSKQSDESKSGCAAKSVNRSLSVRKLAAEVNIHLALENTNYTTAQILIFFAQMREYILCKKQDTMVM